MGTKNPNTLCFFCALETFFRHAPVLVIIHENASPDTAAVSPRCFS